ncbi:lipoate--protein ligase family protein [Patescibacteria group bacterium]|nr:lipoate--protein ligase family protein [Patescibacteria group bacterium]
MKWRIIDLETHDAFTNMAIDEAICESVSAGGLPTIRFYRWDPSAVSIGCFQSLKDEVDLVACKEAGVDVVRRRTGGGAVYHDFNGELTYSVIVSEKDMPLGITESYKEICGWIIEGLAKLGILAEFKPINDVVMTGSGQKISGNAQTRRGGVILQHGTILFEVDVRRMFSVLKVGADKISDKMIAAVEERVTSLSRVKPGVRFEEVYEAVLEAFTAGKEALRSGLTDAEKARAADLVEERYKKGEWNESR